MDEGTWERHIQGLRQGDRQVVAEFCARYGQVLERIAQKHLPRPVQRRVGPEDVVQSVCRTFFRRAREGEFQLDDSEGLWRLLCAITLAKAREKVRYHLRQKRSLAQEVQLSDEDSSASRFGPADPGPDPAEAAEFSDQFQQLIASFDEEERQLVDLKLQQCTNDEAAEKMGCSERTVRRILKRIQARLGKVFEQPNA